MSVDQMSLFEWTCIVPICAKNGCGPYCSSVQCPDIVYNGGGMFVILSESEIRRENGFV